MTTATNYRISNVQRVTLNGYNVIAFTAHRRDGNAFVHVGQFTAPAKTAKSDLWKIADDAMFTQENYAEIMGGQPSAL